MRIPEELAYSAWDIELVIERQGDELRIRPAQRRMGNRMVLDSLLEDILVASFDSQAAKAYGPIRAA